MRAWAVVLLLGIARPAVAVECAPIAGGEPRLAHIDAEVRLRFVRDRLRVAAHRARIWSWSWAGLYSSLTVGNLLLSIGADHASQIDDYVGAAASFVGVATIAVSPLKVMSDQWWLERRLRRAPPSTDRCALVADAERLLLRDADSEAFGKSPLVHAGNFAFNIGVGLLLGMAWGHWDQAAIQGLVGIVVGEAMIWTQPDDAVRDLARYRQGNLGVPPSWRPLPVALAPLVTPTTRGLAVGGLW